MRDARHPLEPMQGGRTPLHLAVKGRHLDVARLLIDKKANVNAVDNVSIMLCLDGVRVFFVE